MPKIQHDSNLKTFCKWNAQLKRNERKRQQKFISNDKEVGFDFDKPKISNPNLLVTQVPNDIELFFAKMAAKKKVERNKKEANFFVFHFQLAPSESSTCTASSKQIYIVSSWLAKPKSGKLPRSQPFTRWQTGFSVGYKSTLFHRISKWSK